MKDMNGAHDNGELLQIGMMVTADFGISGRICNLILFFSVDSPFKKPFEARLMQSCQRLCGDRIMIIYIMPIMVHVMLYLKDQCL